MIRRRNLGSAAFFKQQEKYEVVSDRWPPSGEVHDHFGCQECQDSAHGPDDDVVNIKGTHTEYQFGHVDDKSENGGGNGTVFDIFLREGQAEQDAEGNQRKEVQHKGVENDRYILCAGGLYQFKEGLERHDVGKFCGIGEETGLFPNAAGFVCDEAPKQECNVEDREDLEKGG